MGPQNNDGFDPPPAAIPVTPPTAGPALPPTTHQDAIDLIYANENTTGMRVDGNKIVLRRNAVLPTTRCIKCNEAATGKPLKRKLAWHTPMLYFLLLLNLLIYAIVALIVQKTAVVHVGLCKRHKNIRRTAIVIALVLIVVPVIVTIAQSSTGRFEPTYILVSIVGLLLGLLVLGVGTRVITPAFIDDQYVHIKGAGHRYLDSITPDHQK